MTFKREHYVDLKYYMQLCVYFMFVFVNLFLAPLYISPYKPNTTVNSPSPNSLQITSFKSNSH